jgi:Na+-translocating ferredoxin:NAD+ oxidoreductase RNF subunit RnfB
MFLAVSAMLLAVQKDEKLEAVETVLPGLNCGACGFAGCSAYAEAILKGKASFDLCRPGDNMVIQRISEIMGVEFKPSSTERMFPQVHCRGQNKSEIAFNYTGIADCNALFAFYGGNRICKYGCLGLGSCIRACSVGAIGYDNEGCVWVNKEKCISCGRCVEVCPTGAMRWVPYSADYIVACNSEDKGSKVRKYCPVGCTGCKICEKKSPEGGYRIENSLSRIDYKMKGNREAGANACPQRCIVKNEIHKTRLRKEKV